MKTLLLPTHLLSVGLWLGCVLTEAIFERALLGQGRDKELTLSRLHQRVDVFVEIPAFMVVLITGGAMLSSVGTSALLQAKIGFALMAILVNVYCVYLVFRRARCAARHQWAQFESIDRKQHQFGAVVVIGILMALALGLYLGVGT